MADSKHNSDGSLTMREADLEVIKQLEKIGSDMSAPHMIEYHFICNAADPAHNIVEWGKKNGFKVSEVEDGEFEGKHYWYFDLIKPTIPAIENISKDSALMLHLASRFGCEYDGWGCEVVKKGK